MKMTRFVAIYGPIQSQGVIDLHAELHGKGLTTDQNSLNAFGQQVVISELEGVLASLQIVTNYNGIEKCKDILAECPQKDLDHISYEQLRIAVDHYDQVEQFKNLENEQNLVCEYIAMHGAESAQRILDDKNSAAQHGLSVSALKNALYSIKMINTLGLERAKKMLEVKNVQYLGINIELDEDIEGAISLYEKVEAFKFEAGVV